ncbi:MAG: hypothetical protein HN350_11810 [Phycisphaerales bacterium]|nr:hypothetical protein [Phycisphaerales bacterium]
MSRRKKKSKPKHAERKAVKPPRKRPFLILVSMTVIAGVALTAYITFSICKPSTTPAITNHTFTRQAESLAALLAMTPEQLAEVDIAEMNLLCATGLPGAGNIDIDHCLATLDKWAAKVKFETERHLYRLRDPRYPDHAAHFKHSEARFRAAWLISVLQNDIGVHYHAGFVPQDQASPRFKTSKETFINGLLDHIDPKKAFGGNCVSLPVIYAAVGRRLGYPIKLVNSKEHVFCRWEGLGHLNPKWRTKFNFDGSGKGFSIDPDEFYMTWPRKSSKQEVEQYDWLNSLTPKKELAMFMLSRGHVLRHVNNDQAGAQIAYSQAASLHPASRAPLVFLSGTLRRLGQKQLALHSPAGRSGLGEKSIFDPFAPDGSVLSKRELQHRNAMAEYERITELNRRNAEHFKRMTPTAPSLPQPIHRPGIPGGQNPLHTSPPNRYHRQGVR